MKRRYELRNRNNKPHITMIRPGVWHAESRCVVANGDSPAAAYREWFMDQKIYEAKAKAERVAGRNRRKKVDG